MANPTPITTPPPESESAGPSRLARFARSTVRDEAVAARIDARLGARVVLAYERQLGLPSCLGDTSHRVTGVRRVEP
jgi:hypothetical protein